MQLETKPFFFDARVLDPIAERQSAGYAAAEPFPHAVIEEFLPAEVAERLLAEFPTPEQVRWHRSNKSTEKKLSVEDETLFPDFIRQVLYAFNSSPIVGFLEKLTGIKGLIPDPHFRGGGLHQIVRGGKLDVHADFNHYERLDLQRRVNLLLYLNKDWTPDYGGHLELWDRGMNRAVKRILPVFNRCAVFSTTDFAYHGHPDPLMCPEGWSRKSLALYYYTAGRPMDEKSAPHSTLFQRRPHEKPKPEPRVKAVLKRLLQAAGIRKAR